MKGKYYKGFWTGGSEYQVRVDKSEDIYYIYRLEEIDDNELIHTSCCEKNAEAYIEDLMYSNMDYDLNL